MSTKRTRLCVIRLDRKTIIFSGIEMVYLYSSKYGIDYIRVNLVPTEISNTLPATTYSFLNEEYGESA